MASKSIAAFAYVKHWRRALNIGAYVRIFLRAIAHRIEETLAFDLLLFEALLQGEFPIRNTNQWKKKAPVARSSVARAL